MEEKLNKILGDPESLAKISGIISSLNKSEETKSEEIAPSVDNNSDESIKPASNFNISSLDGLLGGLNVGNILEEFGKKDERTNLFVVLKKHVSDERHEKLEKAQRVIKLSKIIRSAISKF